MVYEFKDFTWRVIAVAMITVDEYCERKLAVVYGEKIKEDEESGKRDTKCKKISGCRWKNSKIFARSGNIMLRKGGKKATSLS